jgi:biopolymer transport protein ExbD
MSDIAFLLIIYFLVIAGFNVDKGFTLALPAKNSTRLVLKNDIARFDLDAAGALSQGGKPLTLEQAESGLASALRLHPNLAVVLSINPDAPWQSVVNFVSIARKLNVDSFSFSMERT